MKTSNFYNALIIAAVMGAIQPLHAEDKGKASDKDKSAAKSEKAGKSITSEPLGDLALGKKAAEVEKVLGKPESKGKKTFQEATGTHVQEWNYPAKGLTITMEFAKKNETVSMIRAKGSCALATARGIKIGSPEAAVSKAYGKERDKESSEAGKSFVAGSVYDGVIFTIKDGKVSEIFIGAAAE
jgi:hypothetical protein